MKTYEDGIKAAATWAAEKAAHYDRQPYDPYGKGKLYADIARSILKLIPNKEEKTKESSMIDRLKLWSEFRQSKDEKK